MSPWKTWLRHVVVLETSILHRGFRDSYSTVKCCRHDMGNTYPLKRVHLIRVTWFPITGRTWKWLPKPSHWVVWWLLSVKSQSLAFVKILWGYTVYRSKPNSFFLFLSFLTCGKSRSFNVHQVDDYRCCVWSWALPSWMFLTHLVVVWLQGLVHLYGLNGRAMTFA